MRPASYSIRRGRKVKLPGGWRSRRSIVLDLILRVSRFAAVGVQNMWCGYGGCGQDADICADSHCINFCIVILRHRRGECEDSIRYQKMNVACFEELRHDFAAAAREVREGVVANVRVARFGSVSDFLFLRSNVPG